MGRRSPLAIAVAVAIALGLSGCGTGTAPTSGGPGASGGGRLDPLSLVGVWRVTADGAAQGSRLRLGNDLDLTVGCGELDGTWRADSGGLFVALVYGGPMKCGDFTTPPWLARSVGYRPDGADRLLLDRDGTTVARLAPVNGPKPSLDAFVREGLLRSGVPVPAPLTPARSQDLLGRWVPAGRHPSRAYAEFADGATFHGSDGCNGEGGRWVVGAEGAIVAVTGPSTLIGCDNVSAAEWVGRASRAALDGPALVLLDAAGHALGRLVRDPAGSP